MEAAAAGCRVTEVPIAFVERRHGVSKLSGRVLLESALLPCGSRGADGPPANVLVRKAFPGYDLGPFMNVPDGRRPPGVSMFFPAYNDGGTIASLVIRAVRTAAWLTPDFEVIIVNDGSTDSTRDIADELARTYP